MAKLRTNPITREDILEYLDKNSDFDFEIKTLNLLEKTGHKCRHSGTYTDPITTKIREFDIRAEASKKISANVTLNLLLAIECKNIKDSFPLVLQCMPRARHEEIEEMIFCAPSEVAKMLLEEGFTSVGQHPFQATTIPLHRTLTSYKRDEPVGKSCDQIGRTLSGNDITGSDSDVFEKISQAINSTYDLIQDAAKLESATEYSLTIIKPVLVVPDGNLWHIIYDNEGNMVVGPEQTCFVPYYYGKSWPYKDWDGEKTYNVSHLDIVTFSHLPKHIGSVFGMENEDIMEHLKNLKRDGLLPSEVKL